jgi:hypothetical protein
LCQTNCQIDSGEIFPKKFFLFFFLAIDDNECIIMEKKERKKERKRERKMHVNDFIGSLPRIVEKKVWKVTDTDGTVVQYVSATDNRKSTAQKYIDEKYPSKKLTLVFSHFKGLTTLPR